MWLVLVGRVGTRGDVEFAVCGGLDAFGDGQGTSLGNLEERGQNNGLAGGSVEGGVDVAATRIDEGGPGGIAALNAVVGGDVDQFPLGNVGNNGSWVSVPGELGARLDGDLGHHGARSIRHVDRLSGLAVDAFDADVLIYAAVAEHELGQRVRALFPAEPVAGAGVVAGIGSVLLLPELLTKPLREHANDELGELGALLSRLELRPTDEATAELATALGALYGLRAGDAVHLATAVGAGADRFLTNNRSDLSKSITEIDITYPEDLSDPADR